MTGLFRSTVFLIVVCLAQFEITDANQWAKEIEDICGLRTDHNLYGHCEEGDKKVEIIYYKEHVEAAKKCKDVKDYRCYEACHMDKLGVTDAKGEVSLPKFNAHVDKLFAGHNKEYVKKIQAAADTCHMIDGKPVTLSQTDCSHNQPAIQCVLKNFYSICKPESPVPAVPTEMKKP